MSFYFRKAWCFCVGIFWQKHEKLLLRRKIFLPTYLITKLTLTITLKPCASAAEYTVTSTRKITSAAENIFANVSSNQTNPNHHPKALCFCGGIYRHKHKKITSAVENIFSMSLMTKLTLILNDPCDDA